MGFTASQIRQDLNCFGGFGQQGYGYIVEQLYTEIENILGLSNRFNAILIGAGNLGRAVSTHMSFESRGFALTAIFDSSEALIGKKIRISPIQNIDDLEAVCKGRIPDMAILCIPEIPWRLWPTGSTIWGSKTTGISATMTLLSVIRMSLWKTFISATA